MGTIKDSSNAYITCPPVKLSKTYKSIGELIFTNMHKHSDRIMQIQAETGEKKTYGQVLSEAVRSAIHMRKRGITRDDIICLDTNNHLSAVVPFLGGLLLGVKVASLDPILSLKDTSLLLDQTKPKLLFVSKNAMAVVEEAVSQIDLQCEVVAFDENDEKHTTFSEFLKESDEEKDFRPADIESVKETALILFSSGTTGLPKGICLSHYSIITPNQTYTESMRGVTERSLFFTYPSLYWISTVIYVTMSILTGIPRLLTYEFNPKLFWTYVKKYRPSSVMLAPSPLLEVIKHYPGKEEADTSSIILLATGGGPITETQLKYVENFFPNSLLVQGYGATEVGGSITAFTFNEVGTLKTIKTKLGSCGKLFSGFTAKLVDVDTDKPVTGPYQEGELRIKTDYEMNGYYNLDSSSAWDEEGFLKTGDVLYYDEEYFFYYVYRIKEMMKYKTWHVQPAAIEDVLREHPAVQAAIVTGIPHPEDGDHPMAFVILKYGVKATEEEILNFANVRLENNKQIRAGVKIVEEFPLTPTGKIQRLALTKFAISNNL